MAVVTVPSWLSHLRVDRRGIPVPWINLWGPLDPERLSLRHDGHVGMVAVYQDDTGETEPDFTRQNMQRQRQAVSRGLCQVCARPVPWSRRFLVVADLSVERIDFAGRSYPVVSEPWLDARCARFAMERCPALIRRRRDEKLTLVPVTSRRDVTTFLSRGWVEGPLEAESRRVQPAMWAKLLLRVDALAVVGAG